MLPWEQDSLLYRERSLKIRCQTESKTTRDAGRTVSQQTKKPCLISVGVSACCWRWPACTNNEESGWERTHRSANCASVGILLFLVGLMSKSHTITDPIHNNKGHKSRCDIFTDVFMISQLVCRATGCGRQSWNRYSQSSKTVRYRQKIGIWSMNVSANPVFVCICDFPTAWLVYLELSSWRWTPLFVLTAAETVWSLSCGSGSDIAWDRLTAVRGSLCDYSLQRHFQKSPSLLDPPGALALFCCFFSLEFFNVAQRGIMEKGTLKAPPPPAGRPSRALRPSGGPSPRLLVSGSKDASSTLLSWKKDHSYVSLSFFFPRVYLFQSASSPLLLSSSLPCCMGCFSDLCFIFHGFLGSTRSAVFKVFHFWERSAVWAESSAVMWFCGLYSRSLRTLPHRLADSFSR